MDSRNADPAVFSHRFKTRAIPIAIATCAPFWALVAWAILHR